ncbi:MAG TPA: hypothetical protein PLD47_01235 [Aggregatilineales bacterium]|nr:hypothetical protein [Anaerolineales bacterium]HRE46322.1 hypothetical protein [Aggregatilineales bacterium]
MGVADVLKLIVALITIGFGAYAAVFPKMAAKFVGLSASNDNMRGVAEVRSILGGAFIGVGVAAILFPLQGYRVLGISYLAIALTRTLSIAQFEKDKSPSNVISVVSEYLFAAILILL